VAGVSAERGPFAAMENPACLMQVGFSVLYLGIGS
jgi:hypothetical protein